ncbi:MAG: histidine--tRNA ligase [Cyclobacteriaceae bacterium]|nr:histidine--tRNA ligase [Cyclobacteriaceae bacterium]
MKIEKPSIPKGTRDFGPDKMLKRQFILATIRKVFEKFGYQPLETPAMENLTVLTGKYGAEGDQLLFKILNSGDFLSGVSAEDLQNGSKNLLPLIAEKGLRYDLTVPFARYVVMNQHEITFPFKRYQIQPVWRADRPQRGRYREFYQCDADVVGSDALVCEAEIMLMIGEVMRNLGLDDYIIKVNNRKLLTAITDMVGEQGKEAALCVAIDKLDKIGREKVEEELASNGFSAEAITKLNPVFGIKGSNLQILDQLEQMLAHSVKGKEGIAELRQVLGYLDDFGSSDPRLALDITLARGLSYYTGTILEVRANNSSINSSITGGGRYDNLTSVFGLEGVSGVGFSFGVDRIYDVMEDLDIFPKTYEASTKVLLLNFDPGSFKHALMVLTKLRQADIKSEIYPDQAKIKKQMVYANKKEIPFVLMIGENEIKEGWYQLKNMVSGEQHKMELGEIIDLLSK